MLRRGELVLWLLLAAGLFFWGYYRAVHSDASVKINLTNPDQLVIATTDRSLWPEGFLKDLSAEIEIPIKIEIVKDEAELQTRMVLADGPDLLWADWFAIPNFVAQNVLSPLAPEVDPSAALHPDFTAAAWKEFFVPYLWEKKKNQLALYGLAYGQNQKNRVATAHLLRLLLETEWGLRWARETLKPSTLLSSDTSALPYELRASRLRDQPAASATH